MCSAITSPSPRSRACVCRRGQSRSASHNGNAKTSRAHTRACAPVHTRAQLTIADAQGVFLGGVLELQRAAHRHGASRTQDSATPRRRLVQCQAIALRPQCIALHTARSTTPRRSSPAGMRRGRARGERASGGRGERQRATGAAGAGSGEARGSTRKARGGTEAARHMATSGTCAPRAAPAPSVRRCQGGPWPPRLCLSSALLLYASCCSVTGSGSCTHPPRPHDAPLLPGE